jgi:deoxyribodipyrimidine photo-lyase
MHFPTDYDSILQRIEAIQPVKYASTRNYLNGQVTYLSPYISRGVISLQQIANHVLQQYQPNQIEKFLQELAWRAYWQSVWRNIGDDIFTDIKQPQQQVSHRQMILSLEQAETEIDIVDKCIEELYETGYMHNHMRMYVSSIACNVARVHWNQPSKWMYYHLLDGDLASNSLSWQWVAGCFSSKKYYCNQENINRYTNTNQTETYLDNSYEAIGQMQIPEVLKETCKNNLQTELPKTVAPELNQTIPILVYNSYNLDPTWHANIEANRILLLEPSHFRKFPISNKVLQFIIDLSKNIPHIQVYVGEFESLQQLTNNQLIFKKHPAFSHYDGVAENSTDLFANINGNFNSFFSFWKKCDKELKQF